jgi:hypothetical protein
LASNPNALDADLVLGVFCAGGSSLQLIVTIFFDFHVRLPWNKRSVGAECDNEIWLNNWHSTVRYCLGAGTVLASDLSEWV